MSETLAVTLLCRVHLFDTDMSWPPKFTKLEAEMDDGTKLAFADARRFGKVVVQVKQRHSTGCVLTCQ
jgi:formamidopyrimidine-DNA glycosylase